MTENKTKPTDASVEIIGGIEKREITICSYDKQWPIRFDHHARNIHQALGDLALRIEHIGSTSVQGLAAKPIIDILLVVTNPADEAAYMPQLLDAGYELRVREPLFDQHRMLRTPERDVHVHIFPPESNEIARYLTFRNQLRSSAADRQWYERTKRELARQEWEDMNDYAKAKTEVVESIIAKGIRDSGERGE